MSVSENRGQSPLVLPEIINRPEIQSFWQRGFFAFITSLVWLLWFYLFIPLFTLIGWFFGLQIVSTTLEDQYVSHSTLCVTYGLIIAASGIVLVSWALYNYWRFRGMDRRRPLPSLGDDHLAQTFALQTDQVRRLHKVQVVRVRHDENGNIADFQIEK